jgi:SAM-dependent methyltransferase
LIEMRPTRGTGTLESWLAKQRTTTATRLLGREVAVERVLDLGCGVRPAFLIAFPAREKLGIDRVSSPEWDALARAHGLGLIVCDLASHGHLPVRTASMDVVTMLAVAEHLEREQAAHAFREAYRVLRVGGKLVLTAPSVWADMVLGPMAALNLVSREEISEHKTGYRPSELRAMLHEAGFAADAVAAGYFQVVFNCWAIGVKSGG